MKKVIFSILLFSFFSSAFGQWNTDRITMIGRNALANEDYVLAIQYFNQVIKVKPYLAEPYMYRAMAKISLDDYVGAEQDCNEAIERSPFIPQAFYTRGFARKKLGKFEESIEDFNKALEFSPENAVIIVNRAESRERNKDYDGAIRDLDYYLKLNPKEKSIDYEIGRIRISQNDTVAALRAFDRFIEADTVSPLGYSVRAVLKMMQNDEDGALVDYDEAIKRKSEYEGDYINRGILNVKRNRFNQALQDYNEAIRLDPKNILAHYNRGLLRANLGDNNNAIGDLDKVVKADSTNYEARLQKAYLELQVGDLAAAEEDYRIILNKYPFFVPAYHALADAIEKSGRRAEARRVRTLAFEIENNKDFYQKKQTLIAKNQIARDIQQNKPSSEDSKLTEKFTAQINEPARENRYGAGIRGNIQDNVSNLELEKDFGLTYYRKADELRRTNTYHPLISRYNTTQTLATTLKATNIEIELVPDVLNKHFESINSLSVDISGDPTNADLYFARALDYALVQDYTSAIDDLNKVVSIRRDFALAYFMRANIRNSLIKFRQASVSHNLTETKGATSKNILEVAENHKVDYDMILADLNRTIELAPDFSFAYYNKGNVLFMLKNHKEALNAYNKAISIDPDFAEAYYNRGVTYIQLNDASNANLDISKAGELGIYQAYSILKVLQK